MIDYGVPPNKDEIEVTLFGPGYGEAIAIHLGGHSWVLVDSCIVPDTEASASGEYLDKIGVTPNQVRRIVSSHWHDDHVRGISQLADKYPDADFILSNAFNSKEAHALLAAYNDESSAGLARGTKELFNVIKSRENCSLALHKSVIFEESINEKLIKVKALSPTSKACIHSTANFAQYLPNRGDAINNIPPLKPNLEAVALHIDLDGESILLGSDLEDHGEYGWTAIIKDNWSDTLRPASVYKVAHHGSESSDCIQIWNRLLEKRPVACLTPWNCGGRRLPTDSGKQKIVGRASETYIASVGSRKPKMNTVQLKRLKDIANNVSVANTNFGAVRLRKKYGENSWKSELFGAAQKLY